MPDLKPEDRALIELTRPIIGIENRTAQEAFDIMADRIRSAARQEGRCSPGEDPAPEAGFIPERVTYQCGSRGEASVVATAPLTRVDDATVDRALFAVVMGGAEVWNWLPQKDAHTPSKVAREVMRTAISAAMDPRSYSPSAAPPEMLWALRDLRNATKRAADQISEFGHIVDGEVVNWLTSAEARADEVLAWADGGEAVHARPLSAASAEPSSSVAPGGEVREAVARFVYAAAYLGPWEITDDAWEIHKASPTGSASEAVVKRAWRSADAILALIPTLGEAAGAEPSAWLFEYLGHCGDGEDPTWEAGAQVVRPKEGRGFHYRNIRASRLPAETEEGR